MTETPAVINHSVKHRCADKGSNLTVMHKLCDFCCISGVCSLCVAKLQVINCYYSTSSSTTVLGDADEEAEWF